MPIFNPQPNHIYVGEVYSERRNRYEEDHHLYFDSQSKSFFIVEATEHESGSNISCNHITRNVAGEGLSQLLAEHPELRAKADELIVRHQD
jgi:hypothetical protein